MIDLKMRGGGGGARIQVLDAMGEVVEERFVKNRTTRAGVERATGDLFNKSNIPTFLLTRVFEETRYPIHMSVFNDEGVRLGTSPENLTGKEFRGGGPNKNYLLEDGDKIYQYLYRTASFSLGSVVGDISSVSLHEFSTIATHQPILTRIELGEPITVTNLNQLRITYYRFLDLTGWVTSNGDLIMKEFNGDGYIAKWTPLTLYSNQIIIRFYHYDHSTSRATGYLHNNDTQEGGGVYATFSPSARWEGDDYIKEITLGLKFPPSHKNYTDIEFNRVGIWAPNSTPMNFYFDEPITKTNRETFEFSVTVRITFSMDDDFTQGEIDNLLSLIP